MKDIDHPYPDLDYTCDKCGSKTGEPTEIREDYWVCESCFDDFGQCSGCGDWFDIEDMVEIDTGFVCEECYSEKVIVCPTCNKEHLQDEDNEDNKMCVKCSEELSHL